MRIFHFLLIVIFLSVGCKNTTDKSNSKENNNLSQDEIDSGWSLLFDGKSFKGWHNYLTDTISDQWQITDGAMVYTPHPDKNHGMNNLISDKKYASFILSIDWKISEGGNSGIFWGIFEDEKYPVPYQTGPEIQVLDNFNHPDGDNPLKQSGAIFAIMASKKHLMNKATEWNHFEIEINHHKNLGRITLNGSDVSKFPVHGKEWEGLVNATHFQTSDGFGIHQEGHLGLQDHAYQVSFRNIKIKELK